MFNKSRLNTATMVMAIAAGLDARGVHGISGHSHSDKRPRHVTPGRIQDEIYEEALRKQSRKNHKRLDDCYSRGDKPLKIKMVAQ